VCQREAAVGWALVNVKPPLRLQWILSLTVATALVVAVIVFVESHGGNPATPAPLIDRAALLEGNREAVALIGTDQAPHVVPLRPGFSPQGGLVAAVTAFVRDEIAHGTITGALQRSACRAAAGGRAGRPVFRCTVEVGDVYYPFDGVVVPRRRQVTFCKRDYPPVPSMHIPVSARCT
jgi:hypothetical protein